MISVSAMAETPSFPVPRIELKYSILKLLTPGLTFYRFQTPTWSEERIRETWRAKDGKGWSKMGQGCFMGFMGIDARVRI